MVTQNTSKKKRELLLKKNFSKSCFYLKITEFEDHIVDSYIIGLLVVLITPLIFRLL